MDAVLILILVLITYLQVDKQQLPNSVKDTGVIAELEDTGTNRVAKLNESFYEDMEAFTEISSLLLPKGS